VLNVFTGEAKAFAVVGRNYKVAALRQAAIVNANAVSMTGQRCLSNGELVRLEDVIRRSGP